MGNTASCLWPTVGKSELLQQTSRLSRTVDELQIEISKLRCEVSERILESRLPESANGDATVGTHIANAVETSGQEAAEEPHQQNIVATQERPKSDCSAVIVALAILAGASSVAAIIFYVLRWSVALVPSIFPTFLATCSAFGGGWYTARLLQEERHPATATQLDLQPTPTTSSSQAQSSRRPERIADASASCDEAPVQWLNLMFMALWPKVSIYVETILRESIQPAIQAALPAILGNSFRFEEVQLGRDPLKFTNMHMTHETQQTADFDIDDLHLSLDVVYHGDAKIYLRVAGASIGVSDVTLDGRLTVNFPGLLPRPPFISGVGVFFPNPPAITAHWHGLAEVADWQILKSKVSDIIDQQVCNALVLPNRIAVLLDDDSGNDVFRLKRPRPQGLLRLTVVEARNLKAADVGWTGRLSSSDPFVEVRLGAYNFKTCVVNKTLNPVWNGESFDILVDDAVCQEVLVRVMDSDMLKGHDFLGHAKVSAQRLQNEGDIWLDLADDDGDKENSCRRLGSKLHLRAKWRQLLLNPEMAGSIPRGAHDVTCLLFVGVYSVDGLPQVGEGGTYWCDVQVGEQKFSTSRQSGDTETDNEQQKEKACAASKILRLHHHGVAPRLIAEVLDMPLHSVNEYLGAKKLERSATCNIVGAGRIIAAKFDEAFVFLVRDPWYATVTITVRTNTTDVGMVQKCDRVVGSAVNFDVGRLLGKPHNTEVATLPLDAVELPCCEVSTRMQIRVFSE